MVLDRPFLAGGDDDDLLDPGSDGLLDRVLDDRLVDQRQHLLGLGLGGRKEASTPSCRGEDGLANAHRTSGTRSVGGRASIAGVPWRAGRGVGAGRAMRPVYPCRRDFGRKAPSSLPGSHGRTGGQVKRSGAPGSGEWARIRERGPHWFRRIRRCEPADESRDGYLAADRGCPCQIPVARVFGRAGYRESSLRGRIHAHDEDPGLVPDRRSNRGQARSTGSGKAARRHGS